MAFYAIRRALAGIPTLLLVFTLVFLIAHATPGSPWDIGSNRPIFGKEDRSVLYDVSEVSRERRNGYSWYGNGPARHLEQYRQWSAAHSATPAGK